MRTYVANQKYIVQSQSRLELHLREVDFLFWSPTILSTLCPHGFQSIWKHSHSCFIHFGSSELYPKHETTPIEGSIHIHATELYGLCLNVYLLRTTHHSTVFGRMTPMLQPHPAAGHGSKWFPGRQHRGGWVPAKLPTIPSPLAADLTELSQYANSRYDTARSGVTLQRFIGLSSLLALRGYVSIPSKLSNTRRNDLCIYSN